MTSNPPNKISTKMYESHVLNLLSPNVTAVRKVSIRIINPMSKGCLTKGNKNTIKIILAKSKNCLITKSSLIKESKLWEL